MFRMSLSLKNKCAHHQDSGIILLVDYSVWQNMDTKIVFAPFEKGFKNVFLKAGTSRKSMLASMFARFEIDRGIAYEHERTVCIRKELSQALAGKRGEMPASNTKLEMLTSTTLFRWKSQNLNARAICDLHGYAQERNTEQKGAMK